MKKQIHNVRVCPSPTGNLHMGTIRTAYFNWLISKQHPDSSLLVRIDDTDLNRSQNDLIQSIYDSLDWLGLDYDKSFKQSDRFSRYQDVANTLLNNGIAIKDDGCIRLNKKVLDRGKCDWTDTITGDKEASDDLIDLANTQVLIKSDGSPAYNFASVVDDIDSKITWVVRGVDHIANTYKQVRIFRLLGADIPLFSHVGLICHKTGKKLSKRDSDDIDLSNISRDALLNYVLRLGWSPREDTKKNNIIDRDRAIDLFLTGGKMKSSNAKIDLDKLDWYNKKYK